MPLNKVKVKGHANVDMAEKKGSPTSGTIIRLNVGGVRPSWSVGAANTEFPMQQSI